MIRTRFTANSSKFRILPRSGKRTSLVARIFAVAVTVVILFSYVDIRLRPFVRSAATALAARVASDALNEALTEEIAADADSHELVHVERAPNGDVRVAQFDMAAIAAIQAAAVRRADAHFQTISTEDFRLPVFQALTGVLGSSTGVTLPARLRLLGSVHSSVIVQVSSAGINQSVHTVSVDLYAKVSIWAPTMITPVEMHSRLPVVYVVLAGKVPDAFSYGSVFGHTPMSPAHTPSVGEH